MYGLAIPRLCWPLCASFGGQETVDHHLFLQTVGHGQCQQPRVKSEGSMVSKNG
jgi:hypothetical protein